MSDRILLMKSRRVFTIRKTVLGGGITLLGLLSLSSLGFSNFTLYKSSANTDIEVSVGNEEIFRFDLNKHVTSWSFVFPSYNTSYGFYNVSSKSFSSTCTITATAVLNLTDKGNDEHSFQEYYTDQLLPDSPTSLTFYSRLKSTSFNLTNDNLSNVNASVNYSYTTTTASGQSNVAGSSAISSGAATYLDNQITVALPTTTALNFTNWNQITFVMTYRIDYSSYFSNYVVSNTSGFTTVCNNLVNSTFTSSLFLGESYVANS